MYIYLYCTYMTCISTVCIAVGLLRTFLLGVSTCLNIHRPIHDAVLHELGAIVIVVVIAMSYGFLLTCIPVHELTPIEVTLNTE